MINMLWFQFQLKSSVFRCALHGHSPRHAMSILANLPKSNGAMELICQPEFHPPGFDVASCKGR
jgi:hypothetical protein